MLARIIAHFLLHPLGVVGLVFNFAGALLLIWFPTAVGEYQPEGVRQIGSMGNLPSSEEQRRWWQHKAVCRKRLYYLAMLLLVVGFALQLLDLLLA
jgi:hypothetical protein